MGKCRRSKTKLPDYAEAAPRSSIARPAPFTLIFRSDAAAGHSRDDKVAALHGGLRMCGENGWPGAFFFAEETDGDRFRDSGPCSWIFEQIDCENSHERMVISIHKFMCKTAPHQT